MLRDETRAAQAVVRRGLPRAARHGDVPAKGGGAQQCADSHGAGPHSRAQPLSFKGAFRCPARRQVQQWTLPACCGHKRARRRDERAPQYAWRPAARRVCSCKCGWRRPAAAGRPRARERRVWATELQPRRGARLRALVSWYKLTFSKVSALVYSLYKATMEL
jgi:hypothetical protein